MSEQNHTAGRRVKHRDDRRVYERFELDGEGGCLHYKGKKFPCQVVDVSLGGCCVRTESRFLPGSLANVEVVLPIQGMLLRMAGTTQWLSGQNLVGVRFLHGSFGSKNSLASLLTCLVDESATEEVKAAVAAAAQTSTPVVAVELSGGARTPAAPVPASEPAHERREDPPAPLAQEESNQAGTHPAERGQARASQPETNPTGPNQTGTRPEESEHEDRGSAPGAVEEEWRAELRFLKDGSRMAGVIVGLNGGGCSVKTTEPFVAGLHIRLEVDFQMLGLPFLLGGVTEDIRERHTVDIRFLDMSRRKQEELAELIGELQRPERSRPGAAVSVSL
jgi:hypothetical protein